MYGHKETIAVLRDNHATDDMHCAAARGDLEAMEELLAAGRGDVNAVNRGLETPLMWASANGRDQAIRLLLKSKANVNTADQHGFTSLMQASQGGHLEAMKVLMEARADVNASEPEDDETALVMANRNAQSEAAALLLEMGAEPEPDDAAAGEQPDDGNGG